MSIVEAIPDQDCDLHHRRGCDDGEEVPSEDMIDEELVIEKCRRKQRAGDAADARRAKAVHEKALVDRAEDRQLHYFPSKVKMSSVACPNTRENMSASARLGS